MNQWLQKSTAAILAVSVLVGSALSVSAATVDKPQKEELKIASLSDTHYLSPDLIKDTADFTEHLNSDRKMFAESDAFLTALLDTIKQDDPDVLLISGDLTKDGEKEGHEDLAEKLKEFRKEEMPDLHIYITPGNHDLNNANGMNFNTADGVAVPAGRTSQQDYKNIYADLTYNDETVIATFTPAEGKQGGGLSYAARPKDGFTVISIDSARYSADNTDSGIEEHETSGAISADLENWVLEQIAAAKKRGDTVIGLQHHGYIPHFSMEPDLLPMYLVNDYDRLSREFADAGMQYVFTGHMHANDIASITTENGNTLYDIETGSVVTYPSPARSVTITRTIENGTVKENMDVKTYLGVGPITFTNPATGEKQTIEDITAYGQAHGFSNDMLTTTVNGFLHGYYTQIAQSGGSKATIEKLINDMLGDSLPGDNLTMEKLIDVGLPLLLPDAESGEAICYDSSKGGIAINYPIFSTIKLNVVIPNNGLKDALNVLFEKLDDEVLADPAKLDAVIGELVSDLTSIPVAMDGETQKTLLDYANFIYQSHLGGEENGNQPAWVTETAAKIESGEMLEAVLDVVITDVADLLNTVLANITFEELVGSLEWDHINKCFVPSKEGRTPLLKSGDENGGNIPTVIGILGAKWKSVSEDINGDGKKEITKYVPPEGTINPELGYTLYDFIYSIKLLKFDMHTFLDELLNGTPATEEVPAEEGLLTDEIKGQLNTWLLNLVNSMGTDDNYPQDNNTTITYAWNLLTNRTALDEAIAEAEKIDLSKYTEETADVVTKALTSAKDLSLTATQEEMDAAAKALDDAVAALKVVSENKPGEDTNKPGDNTNNSGNNTSKPGEDTDAPQTGDTSNILSWVILMIAAGAGLTGTVVYGKKRKNDAA